MNLSLVIKGTPKAVQSARFAKVGGFMRSYQPKEQVEWKTWIKMQASAQLPEGWTPVADKPVALFVTFVFPPLKGWSKDKLARLKAGDIVHKITKPDLSDNLMKGLVDAMTGILWIDDALIAEVASRKIYGEEPATHVEIQFEA